MKFIIQKGTKLYDDLKELFDRANEYHQIAKDFVLSLGYSQKGYYAIPGCVGGVYAIIFDEKNDIPKGWIIDRSLRLYAARPDKNRKSTKEIRDRIKELPVLRDEEFNQIIGYKEVWKEKVLFSPTFDYTDNTFGISFPDYITPKDYTPHPDMKEVTASEYYKKFKKS